jgi:hypothetical protein
VDEYPAGSGRSYQIGILRPGARRSIWNLFRGRARQDLATEIQLELDDEKVEAIKACLSKGKLVIKVSNVDFSQSGRFDDPYKYD